MIINQINLISFPPYFQDDLEKQDRLLLLVTDKLVNTIEELQHAHSLNKDQTNDVSHQTSRDSINMSASSSAATNFTENDQREGQGDVVTSNENVGPCTSAEELTTQTVADTSQDARGLDAEGLQKKQNKDGK